METDREINESSENLTPKASEKLSLQGRAIMQGEDSTATENITETVDATNDISTENTNLDQEIAPTQGDISEETPVFNPNPPVEHQPQLGIGEKGMVDKTETGAEKTEKKIFGLEEKEKGQPGGLDYYPQGYEKGF